MPGNQFKWSPATTDRSAGDMVPVVSLRPINEIRTRRLQLVRIGRTPTDVETTRLVGQRQCAASTAKRPKLGYECKVAKGTHQHIPENRK